MKRLLAFLLWLTILSPHPAEAHLGSPDVFFEGSAGPYPVRVTIRMPGVVPGRAQIFVAVQSSETVSVAFAPISSKTAVSNTPPAEAAQALAGETNRFGGELWLMTSGGYGIDVRVRGKSGAGAVQIPVSSVATRQLPLPPVLGRTLIVLGFILFCGGIAIIAAAVGESVLPPGVSPGERQRRRYRKAATTSAIIFTLALFGGWKWWNAEELDFRKRLREGGWPDLTLALHTNGVQRVLQLTLGKRKMDWDEMDLAADHGKLAHVYLVREPGHTAFAHIHPRRTGEKTFEVNLPSLPEGNYEVLCDVTLADIGVSSTATNNIHLPAIPAVTIKGDPDDAWATNSAIAASDKQGGDAVCHLPGGLAVIWKSHPPLGAQRDAHLRFEVRDGAAKPVPLELYMGMMAHGAVLRADGKVFAHLHPAGNFSMAAENIFDKKLARPFRADAICGAPGASSPGADIELPYEFPTPGDYRLWLQFKTAGQIQTAIFDTRVAAGADRPNPAGT